MKAGKEIILFLKRVLLFLLPFLLLMLVYAVSDPFRVIRPSSTVDRKKVFQISDFETTRNFIASVRESGYNSFTLGNSKINGVSLDYPAFLPAGSKYFDFHNPGEAPLNILNKIRLISKSGVQVKNVLIAFDYPIVTSGMGDLPLKPDFIHHPQTSGSSWIHFHFSVFKLFLANLFFVKYFDYMIFNTYRPYMSDVFQEPGKTGLESPEATIAADSSAYYKQHAAAFRRLKVQKIKESNIRFSEKEEEELFEAGRLLKETGADVRILVCPVYNEVPFNRANIQVLKKAFGEVNVYDFSGKNEFSESAGYWYEGGHFRPVAGKQMLKVIYGHCTL